MLLLVLPSRAHAAEEGREAIHFEYAAAPDCPPADRFLGQISAYTTRWTLARPGDDARRFVVRIGPRDEAYVGRFDIRQASGETAGRDIQGETCEDAALGLAVAVALAIDPQASLAPAPPPPTEPRPIAEAPRPTSPPAPTGAKESAAEAPIERKRASPSSAAVSVGGRAEVNGAVSGVLPVVDLFVELEWSGALAQLPTLRPAIRGGFRTAFTRTHQVGQTRAEIDWSAGYVEACPTRFAVTRQLAIEGCVGANLGILSAQAPDLRGPGITRRTWLDYGGLLGVRWHPHPHLFVEAVLAVWAPITRDRLRVEPDGVVTRAPPAGISAGIGGGWRF